MAPFYPVPYFQWKIFLIAWPKKIARRIRQSLLEDLVTLLPKILGEQRTHDRHDQTCLSSEIFEYLPYIGQG